MLTLKVQCSNHQSAAREKTLRFTLDTIDALTAQRVTRTLEADGWVVQFNGEHMDTYCTKKCAE